MLERNSAGTPARGEKLLVYRVGSLGDTIVVLPALHLIRRAFPRHHITVLTNLPVDVRAPSMRSILEGSGLVDDWMNYPGGMRDPRVLLGLNREIARRGFDAMVYLTRPRGGAWSRRRDQVFFRLAGISRLIGFPREPDDWRNLPDAAGDLESECARTLRCLRELGTIDAEADAAWDLKLSADEVEAADRLVAPMQGKSFLVASIGTKAPANDWEMPNWRALLDRCSTRWPKLGLVMTGAPAESSRVEELLGQWRGPIANLCGQTSPRVAAAVMRRAEAFFGHDSGPMHLAASVGTPVIAVFSARNPPGVWFPRGGRRRNALHYHRTECFGCGLVECHEERKRCIRAISVDEVFASFVALLEPKLGADGNGLSSPSPVE